MEKALRNRADNFVALLEKVQTKRAQQLGNDGLNQLKRQHHNQALEDLLLNTGSAEYYSETESPELDSMRTRALGFVLSKDYWGRGLMPEAVNAVIRWLFEEQELDAILCAHFDCNTRSARVQQKCGFRFLKESSYKTNYGTVEKDIINVLYREAWENGIR